MAGVRFDMPSNPTGDGGCASKQEADCDAQAEPTVGMTPHKTKRISNRIIKRGGQ